MTTLSHVFKDVENPSKKATCFHSYQYELITSRWYKREHSEHQQYQSFLQLIRERKIHSSNIQ